MLFLCDGLGFFQCVIHVFFLFFWFFCNFISNPSLSMFICNSIKAFHFFFAFIQFHHKWFFLLDFLLQLHRQHFFSCVYIYVLLVVIPLQFYLVIFIFFSFFLLCFPICEVHIVSFQGYIKSNSNFML